MADMMKAIQFYMQSEKMGLYHEIKNCFQFDLDEYTETKVGLLFPMTILGTNCGGF